jgi:hypothetical protein
MDPRFMRATNDNTMKNEVFEIDHDNPKKVRVKSLFDKPLHVYPFEWRINPETGKRSLATVRKEYQDVYLKQGPFLVQEPYVYDEWEQIPEPQERFMTIDELIDQGADWLVKTCNLNYFRIDGIADGHVFVDDLKYTAEELHDNGWQWTTNDNRRNLRSFKIKLDSQQDND